MRHPLLGLLALALLTFTGMGLSKDEKKPNDPYAQHIAATDPRSPDEERKCFRLPPGFEAELVAADPDIHKPMNMAFDDKGRLWLTESVEYPFPKKPGEKARDAVKILEDFDEHGRARKISTFVDGLNIPIGVLPLSHYALVYSIPSIFKVPYNGSARADQREVLYGTFGHHDTHGMTSAFTVGFDGWVYACHGFSNTSEVAGADKAKVVMQSGNVYRMRPDGSHAESFTHGQVNPFGLAFDPLGNLYSCDCHTKPIMQLLRGGYYDSFGKAHDGLGYAPDMIERYDDSTAIAGIAYYTADHYPAAHQGNAFIGDVVTNCVNEFRLDWHGSTPHATKVEFLRSTDPWFRPVVVTLGPDGALYVADFYNRIIGHYEVPLDHPGRDRQRGRIWRIVYRGPDHLGKPAALPDFTKESVADLVGDLASANLTVRLKATNQLVERPGDDVTAAVAAVLQPQANPWQRAHALWVLERRGALDASQLARAATDPDRASRVHVQRILAERKELSSQERQLAIDAMEKDGDALVRRCAADALGRHPYPPNMNPLMHLRATAARDDTHLIYVVREALRDTLLRPDTWTYLEAQWAKEDPKQARQEAASLADVALAAPTPEAAAFLLKQLPTIAHDRKLEVDAVHHVARHGRPEQVDSLLAFARTDLPDNLEHQVALFRVIEQGTQERGAKLTEAAAAWAVDLTGKLLTSLQPNRIQAGIELAGALRLPRYQDALAAIAADPKALEGQRIAAFASLTAIDAHKHTPLFGRVLADPGQGLGVREQAAHTLGKLNDADAQKELLSALPTATARLQSVVAVDLASSPAGAEKLLEAVAAGKASARLLQERPVEVRLTERNLPNVKERLAKLTAGLQPADQRLQELMASRRKGFLAARTDLAAGTKVFEKNCAICHQLGGQGAKIGPQLDGVGIRGIDRLLEDILDPSRNVDQAFRLTSLELKNGTLVTGLLLREEGQVLVLADDKGKEVRVEKDKVAEKTTQQLSPMPGNFVDQVPEAEFYNLIAYLLAQRAAPTKP